MKVKAAKTCPGDLVERELEVKLQLARAREAMLAEMQEVRRLKKEVKEVKWKVKEVKRSWVELRGGSQKH